MAQDAQMLKGVLSLLLLRLVGDRDDYGYALVVRLQGAGFTELTEGSVYPALTRLESAGLLDSRLVRSTTGPARKYYNVTTAGQSEAARALDAWVTLIANVDRVLKVRNPS
ncbi:PadR family transcriptional regulator [Cryobacterium suzukii]|uniref:PadR family transcriptional regulator n=1 Tax=Cryobacterium suzukii TaxID=1259198 RepID=A0A4R9AHN1_9MICO|nr:PadR family transcriptional regulator [Cryobacterium suzukii]TFD62200.1 PadR family transcriptional regulator [Cryobacterium suzukii]